MVGYSQPSGEPKIEMKRFIGEISADEDLVQPFIFYRD
jgi:hypothetical protein